MTPTGVAAREATRAVARYPPREVVGAERTAGEGAVAGAMGMTVVVEAMAGPVAEAVAEAEAEAAEPNPVL
ncbi:hypothetical protein [Streptomyces sp. NPDC057302]|uniref:hypothetical protein n=1 Tax=Streptomyces sp. NPDC057302 TaxID=3346094 RepID=UPI003633E05C